MKQKQVAKQLHMFWHKDYAHVKIKCYSAMCVFLKWGTLSTIPVISIQLLFLSSNYIYSCSPSNSSLSSSKILNNFAQWTRECWKVHSVFLYFLDGPYVEMIVWFNSISMHMWFAETGPLSHWFGHSEWPFAFPSFTK